MSTPGDEARHARQILLPEIGRAGQSRIAATTARVAGSSLANRVAARYATGAGFASVVPGEVASSRDDYPFFSSCAADVCRGARATLGAIREAIRS